MISVTQLPDAFVIVVDTPEDMEKYKQLIQRGANLWPDAPPSIKKFADLITVGHIQQDYSVQDTSKKEKPNYDEF